MYQLFHVCHNICLLPTPACVLATVAQLTAPRQWQHEIQVTVQIVWSYLSSWYVSLQDLSNRKLVAASMHCRQTKTDVVTSAMLWTAHQVLQDKQADIRVMEGTLLASVRWHLSCFTLYTIGAGQAG